MIGFTVTLNDVNFLVTITAQLFGAKFQQTFKKMTHLLKTLSLRVVSSTFKIAQILVQSHFEPVSSVLALEATEPVFEPLTQMAVEMRNNHLISVEQKR